MSKHYITPARILERPAISQVVAPTATAKYSRVCFKVPVSLPYRQMPGNGEYKEYISPTKQEDGSALIEHMGKKYEIPSGNIALWELA
jgi:hypothetical protein